MFLLHFVPDSFLLEVINLIIAAGILLTLAGFMAGFITRLFFKWGTGLNPYKDLLLLSGVVLLVAGVYFKGGYGVEQEWRAKVEELQKKIAIAEDKSKAANVEIQTKIVTKTKTIHDIKVLTKEINHQEAAKIDAECVVAPEAITIINAAARGEKPVLNLSIPAEDTK